MRDAFPEYYPLSPMQERACIVGGTVVLDTNVLFALYRFSTAERERLLHVLEQVQDRLWVPHQVALEYQRARESVIRAQAGQYESVVSLVAAPTLERLTGELGGLRLPAAVRSEAEALLSDYVEAAKQAAQPFVERANALVASHVVTQEEGRRHDPVRERLDLYLAGRVGPRVDDRTRTARIQEALERYEEEVPPGFKDSKKDSDELRAGDYLLWRELLDHASSLSETDSLLFVTGDVKIDWFTRDGDPRPELRREFAEVSPATYHQVSYSDFLKLANEHLDSRVPIHTIDRADDIQSKDWYSSPSELLFAPHLTKRISDLPENQEDYIAALLDRIGDIRLSDLPKDQIDYLGALRRRFPSWSAASDEEARRALLEELRDQRQRDSQAMPDEQESGNVPTNPSDADGEG